MSCSFLPTVSRESVRLGSEASSLIQTSFKSSEQNKKNQSLVLLDLFIGPVRLKRSHSVCFPAEALRVSVCRFEALREDLVTVISCVWIHSARSGAFLFTTLWFSYKCRFYRSGCQKSSLQECVTPASRHAGVMKQSYSEIQRNTALIKNISVGEYPADPLSVTDLKEQFDFLETGSLFLIFMLR